MFSADISTRIAKKRGRPRKLQGKEATPGAPAPPSVSGRVAKKRGRPRKLQSEEVTSGVPVPPSVSSKNSSKRIAKKIIPSGPHTFKVPRLYGHPKQHSEFEEALWSVEQNRQKEMAEEEDWNPFSRSKFPGGTDYGFLDAGADKDGNVEFLEDMDIMNVASTTTSLAASPPQGTHDSNGNGATSRGQKRRVGSDYGDASTGGVEDAIDERREQEEIREISRKLLRDIKKMARLGHAEIMQHELVRSAMKTSRNPRLYQEYKPSAPRLDLSDNHTGSRSPPSASLCPAS